MLTRAQAAKRLGISPERVGQLIAAEKLRATKFGNQYMIDESELANIGDRGAAGWPKGRSRLAKPMTKTALKIFRQLHGKLADTGIKNHPAPRDGYAALWLWMSAGQSVERITLADVGLIPPDLRLDAAPLAKQAVGYILVDPHDWIVLARLAAKESVRLDAIEFAYSEPMLVYAGWRGERRSIVTGCINLGHTPTVAGLRLSAGKNYGELGAADLTQGDADDDLLMVAQVLRRFYRDPHRTNPSSSR